MTHIKSLAIREPLVDTVDARAVVTDSDPFKEIDLYTVQVSDLTFNSHFELEVNRKDYIHAIIVYFSVDFGACHSKVFFGTGPDDRYTHWKQTVFYLHEKLVVDVGDKIVGEFNLKPHAGNERDLSIGISVGLNSKGDGKVGKVASYEYKMC
jgi:protein arginine N-methyltransferase 1